MFKKGEKVVLLEELRKDYKNGDNIPPHLIFEVVTHSIDESVSTTRGSYHPRRLMSIDRQFKVGDIVVATDLYNTENITLYKRYQVKEISKNTIYIVNDGGHSEYYYSSYKFDFVTEKITTPDTNCPPLNIKLDLDLSKPLFYFTPNGVRTDLKEKSMQKSQVISVAKSTGNLAFRFINYWMLEPAANIGKPVFRSVRYFTFVGVIAATLFGYKYPETTKSFVKSCLPKVTVEAPEIFKD